MIFQDYIPSIPIDNLNDHNVLVLNLTSMQNATEKCHYSELVGEPLKLELNFIFPLECNTKVVLLGERMPSVALEKFGVFGKIFTMNNMSLQRIIKRIPLLKCWFCGSFPFAYDPTLDYDTFAIINRQPSNQQGEHWIKIANSCQKLYFADRFGRKL